MRIERVALKHHRKVALLWRQIGDVLSIDQNAPRRRPIQAGNQPQDGALAAARGADQHHQLAVSDVDAQLANGHVPAIEDLSDGVERDRRHQLTDRSTFDRARGEP